MVAPRGPGGVDRRVVPCLALAGAAGLWATWPDAGWARLAALGPAFAGVAVGFGERRVALLLLAVTAVAAAPMLPASVTAWRAWASAALLVVALDGTLASLGRDPASAWSATGRLVGALLAGAVALAVWRPTQAALYAPDSLLPGILMVSAVGTAIAVVLVSRDAPAT